MIDKILNSIGKFAYRFRYLVLALFVLLFGGAIFLQSYLRVAYSYVDHSEVFEVFPLEDTLVIVYDNFDEKKIPVITKIEKMTVARESERLAGITGCVVQKEDTLWDLAKQNKTTIGEICKTNNLSGKTISEGEKLIICRNI